MKPASEPSPMQNVEFKAELRDIELARSLVRKIQAVWAETLQQTDTYFRLADGRLKRRETLGHPTEWIFYHRDDAARARLSRFTIYSDTQARQHFGSTDMPVWVRVKKVREVYMHLGTRIHLDQVEGLGTFIEFEAMVSPRQNLVKCYEAVHMLRQALSPVMGEILSASYSDMLAGEAA